MHLPALIKDLSIILAAAAAVTLLFSWIRQPVVLGYVVAGILLGPSVSLFGSVTDLPNIRIWGELGVIFLMFTLGLDFSFRRLASSGGRLVFVGAFEITGLFVSGFLLGRIFGWSTLTSLFLGGTMAISSTTIIVKAFENLKLTRRKFAETVYGVLIVEDLVAILILVALSSLLWEGRVQGWDILMLVGRLLVVIGTWMLIGIFAVPRLLNLASRSGSDELLTILSLGLCLTLVTFAVGFGYSPALGAFIMGSIIAETREAKRIEQLIKPLRDLFVAVFFVSIGMLIEPQAVIADPWRTLAISGVVVAGKILFVTSGALLSGLSLRQSVQASFSMTQIGEFSFIIAGLGVGATAAGLPTGFSSQIVVVSLLTTLTTPILIQNADRFATALERWLPPALRTRLDRYVLALDSSSLWPSRHSGFVKSAGVWLANGVLTTTVFALSADHFLPFLESRLGPGQLARAIGWSLTVLATLPFLWAMATSFRRVASERTRAALADATRSKVPWGLALLVSRFVAVLWVGLLSVQFLSPLVAILLTAALVSALVYVFYTSLERSYLWIETRFRSELKANTSVAKAEAMKRLAPWDAHLVQLNVHADSEIAGRTLLEARLRERFGLNIVAIQRGSRVIVAPQREERLFPDDELLVLATDEQIEGARRVIETDRRESPGPSHELSDFEMKSLVVDEGSFLCRRTILGSQLRERFGALVVGVERDGRRVINPPSQFQFVAGDRLWVVGSRNRLNQLV